MTYNANIKQNHGGNFFYVEFTWLSEYVIAFEIQAKTSLNYNWHKVESKEAGLRRDEVENKDIRKR